MKKLFIIAVSLLTISAGSLAGTGLLKPQKEFIKYVKAKEPFEKIVVNNDIDVVLTQTGADMIEVKGEAKDLKNVCFFIKNKVLYIGSKTGSLKNKAVAYISVRQLLYIEINGHSKITNTGLLSGCKLKVQVNGEALVHLKSLGEIIFEADEMIDLHFIQNSQTAAQLPLIVPNAETIKEADQKMDALFLQHSEN